MSTLLRRIDFLHPKSVPMIEGVASANSTSTVLSAAVVLGDTVFKSRSALRPDAFRRRLCSDGGRAGVTLPIPNSVRQFLTIIRRNATI